MYTPKAEEHLDALTEKLAERIMEKIDWYAQQSDPLSFAEPLQLKQGKYYRFRIRNYRAIFTIKRGKVVMLLVHAVKNRKEAYR